MTSRHFYIRNAMFIFLLISLLLSISIAQGATLDVYVLSRNQGVGNAAVFIDGYPVGNTFPDGSLKGINISPGYHTVVASWNGMSGTNSFTAQSDSNIPLTIEL